MLSAFLMGVLALAAVEDVADYIRPECGVHRVLRDEMIEQRKLGDQSVTQKNVDDADARYQKCFAGHLPRMTEEEARARQKLDADKDRDEWMKRPLHPAGAIAPVPRPALSASDKRLFQSALRCHCRGRACAANLEPMAEKPLACKSKRVSDVLLCMTQAAPCKTPAARAAFDWLLANPQ